MATETLALRDREEARAALGQTQDRMLSSTLSRWDPYEVWRTRILPSLAEHNRVIHTALSNADQDGARLTRQQGAREVEQEK
jgi:hypothetical protein